MSPSPAKRPTRRALACASGVTLFALAPKCLLCLGAYLGVGALFGLKFGPEICSASATIPVASILWFAAVVATGIILVLRKPLR